MKAHSLRFGTGLLRDHEVGLEDGGHVFLVRRCRVLQHMRASSKAHRLCNNEKVDHQDVGLGQANLLVFRQTCYAPSFVSGSSQRSGPTVCALMGL
jgi:hypothetical protein